MKADLETKHIQLLAQFSSCFFIIIINRYATQDMKAKKGEDVSCWFAANNF